ncbi:MAG: YraN family protein [Planctomycetota bacterium]
MDRRERGRFGERAAERLLRRAGLTILARNWRGAGGELDLAALEDETFVFVEVKGRARGFDERSPVNRSQRRRIGRAARAFRSRYGVRKRPFRLDLVTVSGNPADPAELTWVRNFHRVKENA